MCVCVYLCLFYDDDDDDDINNDDKCICINSC